MKKRYLLFALGLALSSCASYRPVVDLQGTGRDQAAYERDLKDCQDYAKFVSPETEGAIGAGIGAFIGGAIGFVVGASIGRPGDFIAEGAALGALSGGVQGAANGIDGQINIIRNCLMNRGYRVLR